MLTGKQGNFGPKALEGVLAQLIHGCAVKPNGLDGVVVFLGQGKRRCKGHSFKCRALKRNFVQRRLAKFDANNCSILLVGICRSRFC